MDDARKKLEERTVILAALLRGVEESLRMGRSEGAGDTPSLVSEWRDEFNGCVDANLLEVLTQADPTTQTGALDDSRVIAFAQLLSCADQLASAETASSRRNQVKESGLAPVFDRIELLGPHQARPRRFRYHALSDAHAEAEPPFFAVDGYEATSKELADHITNFREQQELILHRLDWSNFDCVYTHILNLLQTYAWCIPSDPQADPPQVSLYDRSRMTSAIAACLYKHHAENGELTAESITVPDQTRCILLTGGVSGIQNYLFGISTIGAGGVAKRLRARSFFIQLLSDVASLRILSAFGLPLANLLMSSGSKFYALLPNIAELNDQLTKLQRDFDQSTLQEFHGELAMNLAWTELSDSDFVAGSFGDALARAREVYQERKTRRLSGGLQDESGWRDEFVRDEKFDGKAVCAACGRFPAERYSSDERPSDAVPDVCKQCDQQRLLGQRLTRAKYVSFFYERAGDVRCFGIGATASRKPVPGAFLVMGLNDPNLIKATKLPAMFRYLANHTPHEQDGTPWSFADIAARKKIPEHETPKGMLGVVKADVDYLGQVFQEGLRRDPGSEGLDSASRLATLSRQLDWFFSGWVEWLLATKYSGCYSVYSGGDDLLIVGPRAASLDLVRDIREAFSRYTQHSEISISAGVAVVKPRLPLAHTVEQADQALRRAKSARRNRLCLLNQIVDWTDLDLISKSLNLLKAADPPSAFLYKLVQFGELWKLWRATHNAVALRFQPLLAYTISRNLKPESELFDWASRLVGFPLNDFETREAKLMDYIGLISKWVLLERRELQDDKSE